MERQMTMIETLTRHLKKRLYLKFQMMKIQTLESYREYKAKYKRF